MTQKPPKHLGKHGAALWSGLVADYGIDDTGGLTLVTIAAECMDRLRDAQELIREHGQCLKTADGGLRTNPAIKTEHDSHNRMLAALRAMNLDLEPLRDKPGRPSDTGWKGRK